MPEVAADKAVPSPLIRPVTEVEIVMAGVVVAVATVPAKPLAETTDAEVTVPEEAAVQLGAEPDVAVKTCPVVPFANLAKAPLEFL